MWILHAKRWQFCMYARYLHGFVSVSTPFSVPGMMCQLLSHCAALGASHVWTGGPDVNLAQQDVFDTLFGTWVLERSTSPEVRETN